jgi:hypothetical protein
VTHASDTTLSRKINGLKMGGVKTGALAATLALALCLAPRPAAARHHDGWDRHGHGGRGWGHHWEHGRWEHREWRGHRVWSGGYWNAPPVVYGNPYYGPEYYPPPMVGFDMSLPNGAYFGVHPY